MSDKDMFEELEKAIDDAFKPEEKKRIKKTLWDYYSYPGPNHTHNHTINENGGYMRNQVYDEFMFGRRHTHIPPDYKQENITCNGCRTRLTILIERNRDEQLYSELPAQFPIDLAPTMDTGFCAVCGNRFRVIGKIKKVISEVEEWQ